MDKPLPNGLTLRFGPELDGIVAPVCEPGDSWSIGVLRVGPRGLITEIERSLGLPSVENEYSDRVSRYRALLEKRLSDEPFYAASFSIDPERVATHLLRQRDALLLAGWDATRPEGQPPRLRDLAMVEPESYTLGGLADRFRVVLDQLSERVSGIEQIILSEPLELMPRPWRTLLHLLREYGVEVVDCSSSIESINDSDTDISIVAGILAGSNQQSAGVGTLPPITGDGTLHIVRGATHFEHAQLVSRVLSESVESATVIVPVGRETVARAIAANGHPMPGFTFALRNDPRAGLLRLLPLFLFEPIDVIRLAEFLWIFPNPLGNKLSRRLLKSLQSTPAVGSPQWRTVVQGLDSDEERRLSSLIDRKRVSHGESIAAEEAADLYDTFYRWASRMAHADDDSIWRIVAKASREVSEAVAREPLGQITETSLLFLVERAIGGSESVVREAGAARMVDSPAEVDWTVEDLYWLPFATPNNRTGEFFLPEEVAWLSGKGVTLEDAAVAARRHRYHTARVLSQADRATLLIPETLDGAGVSEDPMMALLTATTDISKVAHSFGEYAAKTGTEPIPTSSVSKTEEWRLNNIPSDVLSTSISVSSLGDLLRQPYSWFLSEVAKLKRSELYEVASGKRLFGNIVHGLSEMWFSSKEWSSARAEQVCDWHSREFRPFIEDHASVLLLPGSESVLEWVRQTTQEALVTLTRLIAENGWRVAGVEQDLNGAIADQAIHGRADLLLERESTQGIIDLKWTGGGRREKEMKENEGYQLALYALMASKGEEYGSVGYFIVTDRTLLSFDTKGFRQAVALGPREADGFSETVQQTIETLALRKSQIKEGLIPLPELADVPSYDDYRLFLGWK